MDIVDELKTIANRLSEEGIDYALCGGLAMAVYAMPRATLDIDVMIHPDSWARPKKAVAPVGYTIESESMEFRDGSVRIRSLCKVVPDSEEPSVLDFLLVTEGTSAAWQSRREVEWEGGKLRVLAPRGLIQLKQLRQSGTDQDDIAYLGNLSDED